MCRGVHLQLFVALSMNGSVHLWVSSELCVCMCVHSLFMGAQSTCVTVALPTCEKLSDSSDRKVQVTMWYEQEYTEHFWWDCLLFATALR